MLNHRPRKENGFLELNKNLRPMTTSELTLRHHYNAEAPYTLPLVQTHCLHVAGFKCHGAGKQFPLLKA